MKKWLVCISLCAVLGMVSAARAAYHHMDEQDGPRFQETYPELAGTKLDDCTLCHRGNQYTTGMGNVVTESSCQFCHVTYGYDGSGDILETLNGYGQDYRSAGRSVDAFGAIENKDSDNDTYSNIDELTAIRWPGDASDDPGKVAAPHIVITLEDLEADFAYHEQFMLMNTSRSGDYYATYGGVAMQDLLETAGRKNKYTSITVTAPDGFSFNFDREDNDGENYFIEGSYPPAIYYYDSLADTANGGWADYSSPGCQGRTNGQPITVDGGLKLILAYKQDGTYMDVAYLDQEGRIEGSGPFRAVPPQRLPGYPDQLSTAETPYDFWQYDADELETDHNGGFSARGVAAVRVEPLPDGTTEYDWQTTETDAGWAFLTNKEIVVYGNLRNGDISGTVTDSQGNPVERALVSADRGGYEILTDSDGNYSLVGVVAGPSDLPERAEYTLTASASGFGSASSSVTIETNSEVIVDFTLSEATATCPVESAAAGDYEGLELFRGFRDEIMSKSAPGKAYIKQYYRNAPEVAARMLCSPDLRAKVREGIAGIKPAIAAMMRGADLTLSDEQLSTAARLIQALKRGASPGLRNALKQLENDLYSGTLEQVFSR